MNISKAISKAASTVKSRVNSESHPASTDRRTTDRRTSERRSPQAERSSSSVAPSQNRRTEDRRSGVDRRDQATVSHEARSTEGSDRRFTSFLQNFQDSHAEPASCPVPESGASSQSRSSSESRPASEAQASQEPQLTPEEERRQRIEETGRVLHTHADFTNGRDNITSLDDYEKIANGERDKDFAEHLREQNPDWSDARISSEVKNLREHSRRIVDDDEIASHYDTAAKGGDGDGKFSPEDMVAGRLSNDISKELPPNLSVEEINRLHEQNPGLGNEAITNKYYHQAQRLNELLGGDSENFLATWPAFGSLASNSAGSVIRSDGIPGDDRISNQVAQGNRKVFEDIAPRYDSYLQAAQRPDFNYQEWAKQEGFGERDGYLRESFDFLEKARTTNDPDKKQEYLLASNVLAGRHEQGRLDPEIDNSTAPLTGSGLERGVLEAFVDKDPTFFMPNGQGHGELDKLDVSKKIEAPPSAGLYQLSDPSVRDALWRSLGKEGPAPESMSGQELIDATGTEDWSNLNERMRTIAGLMVAGQRDPRLGEYVLDYEAPEGLRTRDHIMDLAGGILEKTPIGLTAQGIGAVGNFLGL
jgi:hypothetical protein